MSERATYDRMASGYDSSRGSAARAARFAADIAAWLPPGRVLDIGVGTAAIAAILRQRGHDVYGVDTSPGMLAYAIPRIGGRLAVGDAGALPVRDASVAAVVAISVLHLVRDLTRAVAEAGRVLVPGGRLVAVTGPPVREPDDIHPHLDALRALRDDAEDMPPALAEAAAGAGLRPVARTLTGPIIRVESPGEVAASIEERFWPYLWRVDASTWERSVEPVIAALRALPDPHRPRRRVFRFRLAVYARPVRS